MNLSIIILFTFRGQRKIIFKAKWDAIKGIPKTWQKRKNIEAGRVVSMTAIWQVLDKSYNHH